MKTHPNAVGKPTKRQTRQTRQRRGTKKIPSLGQLKMETQNTWKA